MGNDKHLRQTLSSRTPQERGRKQEAQIAKETGGRTRPRSGGITGYEGDVEEGDYLIESKTTDKASLSITATMLRKISKEALSQAKIPLMRIMIQGDEWYIVPKYIWEGFMLHGNDESPD